MGHNQQLTQQFDTRSSTFNSSAHWITDKNLVNAHVELAGKPHGKALELCCGTGVLSTALQAAGWDITGLDISAGMVAEASRNVPAVQGNVEALSFADNTFDLIVIRQALFLVGDSAQALKEMFRVLKPKGQLIISQLIPYSNEDSNYLEKVHLVKQAQLKRFYTRENLKEELETQSFKVIDSREVTVRESVSLWMKEAPELSETTRKQVCDMVMQSPELYKLHHQVKIENDEIMEDWNFILYLAQPKKDH